MSRSGPQNYGSRGGGDAAPPAINYDAIILRGDPDELVKSARAVGERIPQVSSSQIRGIFATVRQIQLTWDTEPNRAYRQAVLLKPRIAYANARKNELGFLSDVLIQAIERINGDDSQRRERFMQFVDFFEAIVAYHRALGGNK